MFGCMHGFDGRETSVNDDDAASRGLYVIWMNCIGTRKCVSEQPIQFVSPWVSDAHVLSRLGALEVQQSPGGKLKIFVNIMGIRC